MKGNHSASPRPRGEKKTSGKTASGGLLLKIGWAFLGLMLLLAGAAVVRLARSGDPNGADSTGEPLPRWDAYTAGHPACMVFDDVSHQTVEEPDEKMRLMIRRYLRQHGC